MKMKISFFPVLVMVTTVISSCGGSDKQPEASENTTPKVEENAQAAWVAPEETKSNTNPVATSETSVEKGKSIFTKNCVSCHGEKGLGDTPTGMAVKAANLKEKVPAQKDGELYWKLNNGRNAMVKISSYGLKEEDAWDIINYLRVLTK